MDIVRFGVIGLGNMGSAHIKYLSEGKINGARLTAICDIDPEMLERGHGIAPDAATFSDHTALFDSGLVDAVILAVPHYLHPVMAIEAFGKGINVLTEKPAGVYTKKVYEMNEAAKKSGLLFGIMYNQRTNPLFAKMREMVQAGELGRITRVTWIITDWYRTQGYYNSVGWRATWSGEGGGVLLNQCPHNLDLLQWIAGMPSRITAHCHVGKWHDIEVEDDVTAYLEYPNGATGVFITTTGECPGTNRFEVSGTLGKLTYENKTLTHVKLDQDMQEFSYHADTSFGTPNKTVENVVANGVETAHAGITQNFTNALLHGTPLLAPGEEGVNGLNISNAMYLSSWLNRPVELPVDQELYWNELQKRIAASKGEKVVRKVGDSDFASSFNDTSKK